MSKTNKKNKIIYASAGISAGIGLGLGTLNFVLHENMFRTNSVKKISKFEELIKKRDELSELIKELGPENVSDDLMRIFNQINHKLDSNTASIDDVFDLVNDADYVIGFESLKKDVKDDENIDASIEKIRNLFNDDTIKARADELINQYKDLINKAGTPEEKSKLVKELEEKLTGIYQEQNLINQNLEKSIIKTNALLNDPKFIIPNDLRDQIESLIQNVNNNPNIDANTSEILVNRLNSLIDQAIIENDKNNLEKEQIIRKANLALENLKNQELNQEAKNKVSNEINKLLQSLDSKPSVENDFLDYGLLNKRLDNLIANANDYGKSLDELKDKLNTSLDSGFEFRKNENIIKNKFDNLVNELQGKELNSIDQVIDANNLLNNSKNQINAFRNQYDKAKENIDNLIKEGKLPNNYASELDKLIESIPSEELETLSLEETVVKLNDKLSSFTANVNNQLGLNNEIDEQIKDLEFLMANGLNVDQNAANELLKKFNELKSNFAKTPEEFKKNFDEFNKLSSELKDLHKRELANLIEANKKYLDKDFLTEETKARLESLINSSEPLANPLSASVVSQIKPKEELLRQFLKENQIAENRSDFNGELEELWKDSLAGLDNSDLDSKLASNINSFFTDLQNQMASINNDPKLTNEEKVEKIKDLINKAQKAKENSDDLKDYIKKAQEALETTNESDPNIAQSLRNSAKEIESQIFANLDEALNLDTVDPKKFNDQLSEEIEDYKTLRDSIIGNRLFEDTLNKINYAFVNDRENDQDTPMQTALKNKLLDIKNKLDDPNITDSEREKLTQQIIAIRDNVDDAHELEAANKKLKSDVDNSQYYDFGEHKPEELINSANDLTNFVDNLIKAEQENPDYILSTGSNNKLKDKINEVKELNEKLNREVARNNLINTIDNIKLSKTDYTGEPFDALNESIQNLIDSASAYTDPSTNKTADEINDFNFRVQANIDLAQTLSTVQDQIKNLENTDRDFIKNRLQEIALANKINPDDNFETVQEKTRKIREAITQISSQIKLEEALKELDKVFPKPGSVDEKLIYNEDQEKYQKLHDDFLKKYQDLMNDENATNKNAELIALITDINKTKNEAELKKKELDNNYNAQVELIKSEIDRYKEAALKNNINPVNLSKLEAEFNKLISDNNKTTTSMDDLEKLKEKIRFEYAKDELDASKQFVEDYMAKNFSNEEEVKELKEQYRSNIQDTIDKIYNNIQDNPNASLEDYLNAKKLIDQAKKYAENTKDIIDRINELDQDAKKPEADRKFSISSQPLKDAMTKNALSFDPNAENNFDQLLEDSVNKTNNIKKAYNESLTFDELKNNLIKKIDDYKIEVDNNIASDQDDKEFKAAIDATIEKIKQKTNEVKYKQTSSSESDLQIAKNELAKVEEELAQLQSNMDAIKKASASARVAQDEIDAINKLNPISDVQNKIKTKLEELVKLQRNTYNGENIDSNLVSKTTTEINTLVTILKNIKEFDVKLNELSTKINYELKLNEVEVTNSTTPVKEQIVLNSDDALKRMIAYKDNLRVQMDALGADLENINTIKINELNRNLNAFSNLIKLQVEKIGEYKEIKAKLDEPTLTDSNLRKIHEWSAKFLGDSIIKSALIDNNADNSVFNVNMNLLDIESKEKKRIYNDRLEDFKAVSQYKENMLSKFTNKSTDLDNELKGVLEARYNQTLEAIAYNGTKDTDKNPVKDHSNYTFNQTIQQHANNLLIYSLNQKQNLELIHVQVDRYIATVDMINEKILKADGEFQTLKSNSQYNSLPIIAEFIKETERLLQVNKDAWVSDISPTSITSKKETLENYILRIDLLNTYARRKIELQEDVKTGKLTEEEAKPLAKIIENLEDELNRTTGNRARNFYDGLKEKYLEGLLDTSFVKARTNTYRLKEQIKNAETVRDKYKDYKASHTSFTETPDMVALYERLDQIIATAKVNISNVDNRSEREKENSIFAISDSAFGIIAQLQDKKLTEAKDLLRQSKRINEFMNNEYANITNSPKKNDFEEVSINKLDKLTVPAISAFDWINNTNDLITAAKEMNKAQKLSMFNYERNLMVESIKRSTLYRDLFRDGVNTNSNYTSEALKSIAGLSTEQYNNLDQTLNELGGTNVNIPDSDADFEEEQYRSHIYNDIRSKKIKLDNAYNSIKSTSRIILNDLKKDYDRFNTQVSTNSSDTEAKTIKDLVWTDAKFKNPELEALINTYTSKVKQFGTDETVISLTEESASDYNTVFNNYKSFITKLVDSKIAYEDLLFKNTNSLKRVLNTYLNERRNINTLLSFIASDSYNTTQENTDATKPFNKIINSYNSRYDSIKNIIDSFNDKIAENQKTSVGESIFYLSSAYNATIRFRDWLNERTNFDIFFNELTNLVNNDDKTSYRYQYTEVKDGYILEDFITEFDNVAASKTTNITINGQQKQAVLINGEESLLKFFNTFSILKANNNDIFFNKDNVKVYIYKNSTNDSWIDTILQTDTRYKNAQYNLAIEFSNSVLSSTYFSDNPSMFYSFPNIQARFKTLEYGVITKDHLPLLDRSYNMSDTEWPVNKTHRIFRYDQAGWSTSNALSKILDAFYISNKEGNSYTIADFSTTEKVQITSTSSVNIPTGPYTDSKGLYFVATLNDNVTIDGNKYSSDPDVPISFISTYSFDNHGDRGWVPVSLVVPAFKDMGDGDKQIALITFKFQFEPMALDKPFVEAFYAFSKYNTYNKIAVLKASNVYNVDFLIRSTDTKDQKIDKVLKFAKSFINTTSVKDTDFNTTPSYAVTGIGGVYNIQRQDNSNKIKDLFKDFQIIIKLNKAIGE